MDGWMDGWMDTVNGQWDWLYYVDSVWLCTKHGITISSITFNR